MTPEERLREARKQVRLARESELSTELDRQAMDRADAEIRTALGHLRLTREETDDAEVVE
jgi:hypothetical protein